MKAQAKTIQIFLPGGDPRGIRVAEITTRIVQVIEVPRSMIADFLAMPESGQVSLYFLVGESEEGADQRVYIGQTGDLRARLVAHNKEKEFWERAIVLISRTNSLTQTHTLFLEWYCLKAATEAGRYSTENGNGGNRPYTPPPLESECLEIFETGRTLLSTLGFPLFDGVTKVTPASGEDELFFCNASGSKARGLYTKEGFVVLKGSSGRSSNVPSAQGTSIEKFRTNLLKNGIIAETGDRIEFVKDHLFSSPSAAAIAVTGRRANGWLEWRNAAGITLDKLKRQTLGQP